MLPKNPRPWWLLIPLAFLVYLHGLDATGLLGPDEPRYASIGREMARSGDWVTPRLWGEPWFEKPALLYWMTAAAFRAGIGPDLAPRLPVALLSVAFLVFFYRVLAREFGSRPAWYGVLVLGTCGGWLGYSAVGVTDIPLAATLSAAMLLCLPWIAKGDGRALPWASALVGCAVLAKGLVPLVLLVPLFWVGRRRWRDLATLRVVLPFALTALPWYVLCYFRNGRPFIDKFFIEHHFGRFTSTALLHGQPWWYYVPVLLGLLLPWTPLLALIRRNDILRDGRVTFLALWVGFGLLFFSMASNKLPGYLLPVLPPAAAVMALALDRAGVTRAVIALCAVLLAAFVAASQLLPEALASGLSRAPRPAVTWVWAVPVVVAAIAWRLETGGRRLAAVALVAAGAGAGVLFLKWSDAAEIDDVATARPLWRRIAPVRDRVCVGDLHRNWRYGLNYYAQTPLPDCAAAPRPLKVTQTPGEVPALEPQASRGKGETLDPPSVGVVLSPFRN